MKIWRVLFYPGSFIVFELLLLFWFACMKIEDYVVENGRLDHYLYVLNRFIFLK